MWLVICHRSLTSSQQPHGFFCSLFSNFQYNDFMAQGQGLALWISELRMFHMYLCRENEQNSLHFTKLEDMQIHGGILLSLHSPKMSIIFLMAGILFWKWVKYCLSLLFRSPTTQKKPRGFRNKAVFWEPGGALRRSWRVQLWLHVNGHPEKRQD